MLVTLTGEVVGVGGHERLDGLGVGEERRHLALVERDGEAAEAIDRYGALSGHLEREGAGVKGWLCGCCHA